MPLHLEGDDRKCSGCRLCQLICAHIHFKEVNPKKTAIGIRPHFPVPGYFETLTCTQCGTCASVCPEEAIDEKDGVFIIDSKKCTGCGTCVENCPRECMFLHTDSHVPMKCDLCKECVEMCPTQCLYLTE